MSTVMTQNMFVSTNIISHCSHMSVPVLLENVEKENVERGKYRKKIKKGKYRKEKHRRGKRRNN